MNNIVLDKNKSCIYEIGGIKFTAREMDVIAAILNNRGEKKIANLLDISPRTVSSHVHNIMLKMHTNSKDGIIDFVHNAGKLTEISNYYNKLLIKKILNNYLIQIRKDIIGEEITHYISEELSILLKEFCDDLKIAGIELQISNENNQFPHLITHILKLQGQDYHLQLFKILSIIADDHKIHNIYEEFKNEANQNHNELMVVSENQNKDEILQKLSLKILFFILILLSMMIMAYKTFKKEPIIARANLILPHKDVIIERKELIKSIDKILSNKNKISVAIITGAEGTGKTILSRLYAQSSDKPIIWEIDASNEMSMLASFEKLAYFLLESREDMAELEFIEKLTNNSTRIQKLEHFLSKKARQHPNWLIIYDNVKSLSTILKYFPYDNKMWGNGSVLITTRNIDIDSNDYFPQENVIQITELNDDEKRKLFSKILKQQTLMKDSYCHQLIDNIPPYPLDIMHVANFIKKEQISCENYLNYLTSNNPQSSSQDNGGYFAARNKILSRSIQQILSINPEFKNLLVIVTAVAHHNIPIDLLDFVSGKALTTKFLTEMQKFAFIDKKNSETGALSLHPFTQAIAMKYVQSMKFYNKSAITATKMLNDYFKLRLNQNNIDEVKATIPHIETFLENIDITEITNTGELYAQLGNSFFDIASYNKASEYYKKAEVIYNKYYTPFHPNFANLNIRIGVLYRNIGDNVLAKKYLEKALEAYKKLYNKNNEKMAKVYTYLGNVYRNLGDYDKALSYAQNSVKLLLATDNASEIELSKAEAYLSIVYNDLGKYDLARSLLEKTIVNYKIYYHDNHTKTAWIKVRLANTYYKTGLLEEAKNLILEARDIYRDTCGEESIEYAWTTAHLGIVYGKFGSYKKANELLALSIKIYGKHFKDDHPNIIWAKSKQHKLLING